MPVFPNYRSGIVRAFLIGSLVLIAALCSNAQNRNWRPLKINKLITFDANCAQEDFFPKQALGEIVRRTIKPEDRNVAADRAFKLSPPRHGPVLYFVPTICGATGNCSWHVYTVGPVRDLGEVNGQYFYTYRSSMFPVIVSYGHMNVREGTLTTYVFKRGKYQQAGDSYPGIYDNSGVSDFFPISHSRPSFLDRAVRQCAEYGG